MASHSAIQFEHGDGDDEYLLHGSDSYATNHRHPQELQRLSAFHQLTTKVPPSYDDYDGRGSWFAYEDAIDDWCDITELDNDKRGPALRNRLEDEAAIHKRLLDSDHGLSYFKSFLRPLVVKGAANVFQLSVQRMQEAWNDTYLPITDLNNAEVRAFVEGLPPEEQADIINDEDGAAQLADAAQRSTPTVSATTFFVDHTNLSNFSFMATEEKQAFIAQPLTPTAMVWDLGCTRAMTCRPSAQDLMKFCDQNKDCGIWYNIAETTSQFQFALHRDKAYLSSPVLGIQNVQFMCNVRFDKHKKSSFLAYFSHYEYGFHQKTTGSFLKMRKTKYTPKAGNTPIPLECLDTARKTIMEFSRSKIETEEEKEKVVELPPTAGKTVFRSWSAEQSLKTAQQEKKLAPEAFLFPDRPKGPEDSTSMLGLPGKIYDKYVRLRASSFGDLIFVDHEEIEFGQKAYLALVIIDGASNLLWATALTSLEAPETLDSDRKTAARLAYVETSTPEQLSLDPAEEDLARRVMPPDGPHKKGDRAFVWRKDESKKKSEGVWVRGIAVSQEGAMVSVEAHRPVLRVNQWKVRRDHDPWHGVAIPLKSDDRSRSSSQDEALDRIGDQILERASRAIAATSMESGTIRLFQGRAISLISPHLTGLAACTCHAGLAVSKPVLFGEWSIKTFQSSIGSAWKTISAAEPDQVIIHPVIPAEWAKKAARAFWQVCAEVCHWQDDRGYFVTIMYPSHSGFWSSQRSHSLQWRNNMTFCAFKNKGELEHGELFFFTNLPEGSLGRLESLDEGYDSTTFLDPRFAVLFSQCLVGNRYSDWRQAYLFEDLFEDFDDGSLCTLCLRSHRNSEALPVLPLNEEYRFRRMPQQATGKLPQTVQFVAPQRFVTSSLVQTLSYIGNMLPGVELEVHTNTSHDASVLRPMIKDVRVLTLPTWSLSFAMFTGGLMERHYR
ncbi:unnamed protein product [Symbiodinium sp. CCMP2456]|nr:unnamed protein product [Symbiodinium sp. CCMP2456]